MKIIIIGQNEGEYIDKMYSSLKDYEKDLIWVLDRCTDNSIEKLKNLNQTFIETPKNLEGRQTSFSRNLGALGIDDDILFLDGDRYICSGSLDSLKNSNSDIQLLMIEEDEREKISNYYDYYGTVYNFFYSCGLFIKKNAIEKIRNFQDGKIFEESIQKNWGIEDTYLGDVCYHLNLTCEINKNIRLHGKFEKTKLDNIDVLVERFKLRDKLNVKW